MKKILVVYVAFAASLLFTNNTQAQVKIGIFDENDVLSLIPGITKVDTLMQKYVKDSLQPQYEVTLADYQYKDSLLKADSAKGTLSPSIKKVRIDEVTKLRAILVNWQQSQQQMYQAKQQEYLKPYLEKIFNAFQEVVAEQKYTWVLKQDAVHPYFQPALADNITIKVAKKLGLKLPQEVEDALKAQGLSSGAPAAKPAGGNTPAKTPVKH